MYFSFDFKGKWFKLSDIVKQSYRRNKAIVE